MIRTIEPIGATETLIAISVIFAAYIVSEIRNPRQVMQEEKRYNGIHKKPQNTGRLRVQNYYFVGLFMLRVTLGGDIVRKSLYVAKRPRKYVKLFTWKKDATLKNYQKK